MITEDRTLWEEYWGSLPHLQDKDDLAHEWERQGLLFGYRFVPNGWYRKRRLKALWRRLTEFLR